VRSLLVLPVLLAAALLGPPGAFASGDAPVTSIELRAAGSGRFVATDAVGRFTLAGVRWRGSGTVRFRARSTSGRWSPWRAAQPEPEDAPDPGSSESRRYASWRVGNPWWVGVSNGIEARSIGHLSRIRASLVWSPEARIPYRTPSAVPATGQPAIVPRAGWNADESIRRAPPSYAPAIRLAIIHHTAGQTDYTRAQAPAIVRGIELFHVKGNGWNDIGYNFLVDRFGTIYEGRYGGADRNVIGAHALGFNTGSVGIALLGTYGSTNPSVAALDAIARIVSWKLDLAHVDPTSFLTFISGGSERYPSGVPVLLSAVSGHRDTGLTECPGDALYAKLGSIAAAARSLGGPKIFDPRADAAEASIRFRARLSRAQPWTVVVASASGAEVARGTGAGTAVDWTWDWSGQPAGSYSWTISSESARPATGVLRAGGGAAPLALDGLATEPAAISPNGDGQADTAAVTYRLSAPANVTVEIVDALGTPLATVVDRVWTTAGMHTATVDGTALIDGTYGVRVTARTAAGFVIEKDVPLQVSRILGLVSVVPAAFSPNGDGRRDTLAVAYSLTAPATVSIRIERDGRWVASPLVGTFAAGPHRFLWNGARATGSLHDSEYQAVVEADVGTGPVSFGVPFVSDSTAPRVRILSGVGVKVAVSEPSTLTFVIDGSSLRRVVKEAGTVRIPWPGPGRRVRVVAWDAAGNASAPAVRVRRPG
jgi:N-acetylmuramoyl-L-alanine amidase-like protein